MMLFEYLPEHLGVRRWTNAVEPSMSVNTKVTVPVGGRDWTGPRAHPTPGSPGRAGPNASREEPGLVTQRPQPSGPCVQQGLGGQQIHRPETLGEGVIDGPQRSAVVRPTDHVVEVHEACFRLELDHPGAGRG